MIQKIHALVVDDHPIFSQGLKNVINKIRIFKQIGSTKNGIECLNYISENDVDLVFLDLEMPLLDGVSTALAIKKTYSKIKIIIISMHAEPVAIKTLLDIGIEGYVLKSNSNQELYKAIMQIKNGKKYYTELVVNIYNSIKGELVNSNIESFPKLTTTQRIVLQLICQGKRTNEIAKIINLSPNTIKRYRDQLHKKTNCKSNIELINYSIKNKLF